MIVLLSIGLLMSGAMSTMSAKGADKRGFDHPFVQVLIMFIGEFLCLLISPLFRKQTKSSNDLLTIETESQSLDNSLLSPLTDDDDRVVAQRSSASASITSPPMTVGSPIESPSSMLTEFPHPSPPQPIPTREIAPTPVASDPPSPPQKQQLVSRLFEVVRNQWKFAVPAFLDVIGSSLIFIGIQKTTPSQFQLMRSALVPFTALVSLVVFRKRPKSYEILGITFIIGGIMLVSLGVRSASSLPIPDIGPGEGTDEDLDIEEEFIGNMLVLLAQLVIAVMLVWEEKMYQAIHPLVAIGTEGIWGIGFTCCLLFGLSFVHDESKPTGQAENVHAALQEMRDDGALTMLLLCNMLSVSLLNSFGVALMVTASAAHRTVIDTLRIVLIWIASIAVGWEKSISPIQLCSFALLSIGISLYNRLIRVPWLSNGEEDATLTKKVAIDGDADTEDDDRNPLRYPLLAHGEQV